jgi:hypothetical protein
MGLGGLTMATGKRKAAKKRKASKAAAVRRPTKRKAAATTVAAASMEAATWGGAPFLHLSSEAGPSSPMKPTDSNPPGSDQYAQMFELPGFHSLMNADLATIKTFDPGNPNPEVPTEIKYEGHGVEASIIMTGIAGTKSLSPNSLGYGIPAVSMVQDVMVYGNDDHLDCLVLSTIPFPFSAGTTQSSSMTQCNQAPDLTNDIAGYIIDQVMIGALIAAANATGQQFFQMPSAIQNLHNILFMKFDKAMRTSVGDAMNAALSTLNAPIPFEITTGDLMAPFLFFSVTAFDKNQRTIDIQFNSLGFSTMLRTVDPQSHQVVLGTAISLEASGPGHISDAGVSLNLNYKFNCGTGLLPLAPKYAAQINALIPKLEGFINEFFPPQLSEMLAWLGGWPLAKMPRVRLSYTPQRRGRSLLRWAESPKRRSASLIP